MSAYKQDRLIAQLRADADAANARAAALLAALERIRNWDSVENSRDPRTLMARDAIKAAQS